MTSDDDGNNNDDPKGIADQWLARHAHFASRIVPSDARPATALPRGKLHAYALVLPERRFNAQKLAAGLRMPLMHVVAVPKAGLRSDDLEAAGILQPKHPFKLEKNAGRVACNLSHLVALRHFASKAASPNDIAVVFEDDVDASRLRANGARDAMDALLGSFSENIDPTEPTILYMGYCFERAGVETRTVAPLLYKLLAPRCRHAYAVNRAGAELLLSRAFPQKIPGDEHWAVLIRKGALRALGPREPIFKQARDDLGTTLGNTNVLQASSPAPFYWTPALGEDPDSVFAFAAFIGLVLGAIIVLGFLIVGIKRWFERR